MFSIKYRDNRMSESIIPNIAHVSFHEGVVTASRPDDSVTFGPNMNSPGPNPVVFVMNENGATVAKYELFPRCLPDDAPADPDQVKEAA